ncbi:microsomal glutathione S-transferase 1-like [Phlebotomus argentipes]|uniref:microsomal glutathione S-transferase 1-like n=1 Tax=Phlebotomus argentipes TaxID=94469 RepID=UPI002892E859|nr:microsomal glutathione S-transferase 1-like [Phlebotomus argentipes]
MATFTELLSYDNDVFRAYVFWSTILIVKTLSMSFLTARQRFKNKVFANPEDAGPQKAKVKYDDPDVERVRRAHRNDLENVFPFILVAFFYVLTNPEAYLAINLFRAAVISRIVHTLVYAVWVIPQPARGLAFFVCLGSTLFMAFKTIVFFI